MLICLLGVGGVHDVAAPQLLVQSHVFVFELKEYVEWISDHDAEYRCHHDDGHDVQGVLLRLHCEDQRVGDN